MNKRSFIYTNNQIRISDQNLDQSDKLAVALSHTSGCASVPPTAPYQCYLYNVVV